MALTRSSTGLVLKQPFQDSGLFAEDASNFSQVRFWMTLRSPMKIIFQVIIPPIFAIVGLVLMKQTTSTADVAIVKNLEISPPLYLAQNSPVSKDKTEIIFQNMTHINDIMIAADASKLRYSLVKSIKKAKPPHDVGYEIVKFSSVNGQVRYVLKR